MEYLTISSPKHNAAKRAFDGESEREATAYRLVSSMFVGDLFTRLARRDHNYIVERRGWGACFLHEAWREK